MFAGKIDLHVHSAVSDGTDDPADLVARVARSGLGGFALTDHDTTDGWADARAAAGAAGVAFIPGIEVSTRFHGTSLHMLAYWVDDSPRSPLMRRLADVRASRRTRAQRMVDKLSADFPFTWEDVLDVSGAHGVSAASVGRPHIADALVRAGSVTDRAEAFRTILASGSPYYIPYDAIDATEAIDLIHSAGGVSVGAHVFATTRARSRLGADDIRQLALDGLDGIEVNHREHTADDRRLLSALAKELDLVETGGSDYHGTGKPNTLGENVTEGSRVCDLWERRSPN